MINPRRRTAKARSSKPLLETDNVEQRVVCTIAIIILTFEQKVKGKRGTCEAPNLQCAASRWLGSRQGYFKRWQSQNEDCELYKYYQNAALVLIIQRKIP